ncbi:MAG: LURP-one-related family protein [Candidatus Nanopelagicales bacterium]
MADAPPPADGWSRILFKSKFGAGRDFEVTDASGARVLFVDGKIGPKPKAEVRDAHDKVVYTVKGQFLGIPKRMEISSADGSKVAELKAKAFSIVKDRMTMSMADGSTWQVQGTLMEKNYSITSDGQPIATITQKWLTMRDKYTVDYVNSLDPGLVMAVVWAIDRWVERD